MAADPKAAMRLLHIALIIACLIPGAAQAQNYPARPVRLVVSIGPGGGTDILARHVAQRLGERLRQGLTRAIPEARLNGDPDRRLATIVNLRFAGVDGEAVLHELDQLGITVSTGSACSAATPGPSHVLMALGLRPEDAHASVRFSLGEGNSEEDVDHILASAPPVVERLRLLAGEPAAGATADPALRVGARARGAGVPEPRVGAKRGESR